MPHIRYTARNVLTTLILCTLPLAAALGSVSLAASQSVAATAPMTQGLPDFEEDITLGMDVATLHKLGASPCSKAELCLGVEWGEKTWEARLALRGQKLDRAELNPRNTSAKEAMSAALGQLEEFAMSPVLVTVDRRQCNAFELTATGMSPEKAVAQCAKEIQGSTSSPSVTAWYIDEEKAAQLLRQPSLEKAASAFADTAAFRLSLHSGVVEAAYGSLGSLLQPSLRR